MLEIRNLNKEFGKRKLFGDLNYTFPDTGLCLLKGENGCGKTTLLNMIGLLDTDYRGEIILDGRPVSSYSEKEKTECLKNKICHVFQKDNLLDFLTLEENEMLGGEMKTVRHGKRTWMASEGEKELAVFKRSMGENKSIYLLDEPTHALDENNLNDCKRKILEISKKSLIIMAIHGNSFDETADVILKMENGKFIIVKEMTAASAKPEKAIRQIKFPFFKSLKKSFLFSFLNAFCLFFLFFFTWDYSMETLCSKSEILERGLAIDSIISANYISDEEDVTFEHRNMAANLILDESIADDGKVHLNSSSYKNSIQIVYKGNEWDVPIIQDSDIKEGMFYANPAILNSFTFENSPGIMSISDVRWKTDFYTPGDLDIERDKVCFIYGKEARAIYDGELKDDVFYIPEQFKKWQVEGNLIFDENANCNTSSAIDFGSVFPNGVTCETISTTGQFYENTVYLNLECLVSDNTARKMYDALTMYGSSAIHVTADKLKEISNYLAGKKDRGIKYLSPFDNSKEKERAYAYLQNYNNLIEYESLSEPLPWILLGFDTVIIILLSITEIAMFFTYYKKDIRILYSFGYSKNSIFLNLQTPYYLLLLFSATITYPLIYFSIASARPYPFLPTPDWRIALFIYGSLVAVGLIQYLLFIIKTRKKI